MEERLIIEVEKNPVLFDKSHHLYKEAAKKADIWNAVGARIELTGKLM